MDSAKANQTNTDTPSEHTPNSPATGTPSDAADLSTWLKGLKPGGTLRLRNRETGEILYEEKNYQPPK